MSAYVLTADDTDRFWIDLPAGAVKPDARMYAGNDLNETSAARRRIASVWQPLTLAAHGKRGRPRSKDFRDVHIFSVFKGLGKIVSDRCREVLEREMPGACTFLPVNVENSPCAYWGLWSNTVLDALDLAHSDVAPIGPGFDDVGRRRYHMHRIGDCPIFRLPMQYAAEGDQVTDRFREVVERNGLTNFSFWDRTQSGAAR